MVRFYLPLMLVLMLVLGGASRPSCDNAGNALVAHAGVDKRSVLSEGIDTPDDKRLMASLRADAQARAFDPYAVPLASTYEPSEERKSVRHDLRLYSTNRELLL